MEIVASVPLMLPDTLPVAVPETDTLPDVPVNAADTGTSTLLERDAAVPENVG